MRLLVLVFTLVLSLSVHAAGELTSVTGRGVCLTSAKYAAEAAIPSGYVAASDWTSPIVRCASDSVWNERAQCEGGSVEYVLTLRRAQATTE